MRTALRTTGIGAALALMLIHAYLVPDHLEEKLYIGVLFVVASVLLVVAAVALGGHAARGFGWALGGLVCLGMFVGYVLSRTTGLPGGYMEGWDDPYGTASLVLEVVFVAAAAAALAGSRREERTGRIPAGV